ncbi:Cof-type HAD-IIB family hydrolase [Paenibacillus sp. CAA11]|uniref:Cof-type HAD-IIB family hydrolase n=1 Tax=Paenibacillus sp. CAA11 TaxID=1532905 RepID=UPI000D39A674|nr:Cof-type HAD-IIB family hydrolase [Paenibacillus sp. CAA11]AWB45638.1 Cof-type HAD-IIB family hydrolase [Paenibacillus sp. CAA11]
MNKLIFFDIDGTLLDHDKKIPPATKEAVNKLRENGHEVAIATGRGPFMFKDIREELEIDSYVSFNGQYVVRKGEVIYANPIHTDLVKQLSVDALTRENPIVYMDHEGMRTNTEYHAYIDQSISTLRLELPELDPDYFLTRNIYQCLLFCTEDQEKHYEEQYKDLKFVRWHPLSMDVLPKGGSKAEGISRYIQLSETPEDDVYAFGDALNDLEMLRRVKNSVAMGNADDFIKKQAKHVTKPVDEDGIWHGLRMLGLI